MLAKTEDIKETGANKLLEILTNELKPLEEEGILVGDKRIYIATVQFLGDNLGLNLNMGITAPTSKFFCRLCFMCQGDAKICCVEKRNLLRTEDHYNECISNINSRTGKENYGIVANCALNRLSSFSVHSNFIVDIMHDWLVGLYGYDMIGILKKAIESNLFTLNQFNNSKNNFDYGSREVHYILEDITKNHLKNESVRCHAREMMTLVKFLPFILQPLLPKSHELYLFSLIMTDILDMILKTSFNQDDLIRLRRLITSHNQQFLRLFKSSDPNKPKTLPPKGHYILHYVTVIENIGPVKYLWSMRFESKHQQLKAYAKVCFNRRNLCYSLGKKICFYNAYELLKGTEILKRVLEYKTITSSLHEEFKDKLPHYENCQRVRFNGRMYTVGDFLITSCLNFGCKLYQIAVDCNCDNVMLIVEKYKVKYTSDYRCYQIGEKFSSAELFHINDFGFQPTKQHFFKGKYYIKCEDF